MPQTKTNDSTANAFQSGLYVTPIPADVALKVIAISVAPLPVITAYGAYKLWKWISE